MTRTVKFGLAMLAGVVALGVCMGAYTRDVSRDLDWGILYALEYMISDGIPASSAPIEKTPTSLPAVIIGTPGTPGALASDGTFFTVATIQAGRAAAANASLISIGKWAGSEDYTDQRMLELAPGDERTIVAAPGTKLDLNDWYIDGVDTDDGVRIEYVAP